MTGDFDGLVAAVTGGASGIGAAVVAELAAQGARVAVLDLQEPAEDSPHALAIRTDVSDDSSVRAAIERPSGDQIGERSCTPVELVRLRTSPFSAGTVTISPRNSNAARTPVGESEASRT